jgi:flagellar biosynthesis protein FlhA
VISGRLSRASKIAVPLLVVGVVGLMVLPLPAFALDLLISMNVSLSMVVLLTVVHTTNPVSFSVFPSVLLLITVFRLGLNIASTRRILLHGPEGPSAAGHVIEAFGQFVVGGNLIVGFVVFLVLLGVQFIVINHGANRISEVAARFTLDAMPGKQMSIDADLNAGLIDEDEARRRRAEIQDEADFYGAMDGAVKFTQRDAVASIVIVGINVMAGLAIGILQAGMSPSEAISTFSILTVGDGLVSAIPALLVSVAGALITTRAGTEEELSTDLTNQLLSKPKPLAIAAGMLAGLGLIPGLPTVAFLTLAAVIGGGAYAIRLADTAPQRDVEDEIPAGPPPEEPLEPLLQVDPLTIEVGYDLVEMAGSDQAGGLLERIRALRRQVALELGIVVPPVRVRDNLRLKSNEYQIMLRGAQIGKSRIPRGGVLAIDPGDVLQPIEGEATKDPAFGIAALWIDENRADEARNAGYTVVDRTSVLATHLAELVRKYAADLMGRQETQSLLDMLAKQSPKLVEELIPERYTLGQVQKVLQSLLIERVSIRDLQTICESMADCADQKMPLELLVGRVRQALARSLVRPLAENDELHVVTVAPDIERRILTVLEGQAEGRGGLDPKFTQALVHRVANAIGNVGSGGQPVVLCSSTESRFLLRRLTQSILPSVPFLSVHEVPDRIRSHAVAPVS